MTDLRLFGLIGYPLSHSFSSKYFNDKFEKENLNCRYDNFESPELPDLNNLISANTNLIGLNVTIPYKSAIISSLTSIDENAEQIGAVNVIQIKDGRFKGHNTDYLAFMETMGNMIEGNSKALILGTGGASKAIRYALNKMNVDCVFVSRKNDGDVIGYNDLDSSLIEDCQLIVNTTPLGNYPDIDQSPDIPYQQLKEHHVLYDLTYNPSESLFLKKGLEKGCTIKNGYEMLIKQAELSWDIWNQ